MRWELSRHEGGATLRIKLWRLTAEFSKFGPLFGMGIDWWGGKLK